MIKWLALAVVVALPKTWSAHERALANSITEAPLRAHVQFLADDLLEGRAPASRGSELAMRYIETEFQRMGLAPINNSYRQPFELVGEHAEKRTAAVFHAAGNFLTLEPGKDVIVAAGRQDPNVDIKDAEMVFVGYGITAPEQHWDDYKGVDVHGKIVLVMNNDPEDDPALFAGKTRLYYGRWTYKYEEAARHGAAGAIIIHTTPSAAYPWQVVQSSWSRDNFELPHGDEPRVGVKMWATEKASRSIAHLGGFELDTLRKSAESRAFTAVPLGVHMSVSVSSTVRTLKTANVWGFLPGSDPKLRDEWLVFTAHHDHLGVAAGKPGDNIYNGAVDNASGVAALLTLAQAFASAPERPKRSVLFVSVAAEESGLLGSEYFAKHPPVPSARIAANINIDGINIFGRTRDLTFVGLGKSSIDDTVIEVAKQQGRIVHGDAFPERGGFYRSDQFNFARVGVPALYVGGGTNFIGRRENWGRDRVNEFTEHDYHQPSDEYHASWQLDGAVEDLQLIAVVAWRLAQKAELPKWRPGDEFEHVRLEALKAQ
jgi:Zn-dependent M28 family amino/carboxypeptidase